MSTNEAWRQLAEENGIDCTLRRVEIKCIRQHEPVSGADFMPPGWCGECKICAAMECPDVCELCSYTDKYDLRQPVYWPCTEEIVRVNRENDARFRREARLRYEERMRAMADRES